MKKIVLLLAMLVACQSIWAQEKKDWALIPPKINTSPSPEYDPEKMDFGMIIGMDRTPKGRIWACWAGGGDSEKAFFILATSDDNGEHWSKPKMVIDPHSTEIGEARSALVGNVWTDPDGKLWVFFNMSMKQYDGRAGSWYTICKNPDSDKPKWSKPVRIWHGFSLNKPTVLSSGEWLLPASLWHRKKIQDPYKDAYHELDSLRMANLLVSTDKGKTWSRRSGVKFPNPDFDEHHFTELKDGTIWLTARTSKNGIQECFSKDKGFTWTEPQPSVIRHTSARHFIRRLSSGNLILVKHGSQYNVLTPERKDLTAFISDDDGKTWKGGLLIDERYPVSYPDGFQAPDGTIYIAYDRSRKNMGEILMARFTEEDVLKGTYASPGSKTKILISNATAPRKKEVIEKW